MTNWLNNKKQIHLPGKKSNITNIEKEMAKFDEKFKCIQGDCDGTGHTRDGEDDGQCQFHAEYLYPMKQFISELSTRIEKEAREQVIGDCCKACKDVLSLKYEKQNK